jgi:putative hydrolase of the HAD superfamily
MVGNSLKSDILPVLEAGGAAVYIPYHIEWVLDQAPQDSVHGKEFVQLESIRDLPKWLQGRQEL